MTAMLSHAHALQWSFLMKLLFFLTDKKKELIKVGKISARLENLSYSLNNEYLDQVSLYCSIVVRSLAPKFGTSRRQITNIKLTYAFRRYIHMLFFSHFSAQCSTPKHQISYLLLSLFSSGKPLTIFAPQLRQSLLEQENMKLVTFANFPGYHISIYTKLR